MQNTESSERLLNVSDQNLIHPTWYMLCLKNWNYSHWLMTSTISSLILTELGAVVLSAYPGLLSHLWLSLGTTSSLTIGILSGTAIISLGLITGWLIYAGHLAYKAFTSLAVDYEPLMKLWSTNHQTYGIIFKKLLENDNFLSLSRLIKNYPGAQGLHDYLQDPKNIASVRKILQLLDKIWSTDRIDQQLKMVILHLLSEHMQTDEAEEHIDNIYALCEILWRNEEEDHELLLKVFKNTSLLEPHVKDLQSLATNPELFKQCIDEPNLIPYQLASLSKGQNKPIQALYAYLKQDESSKILNGACQVPVAKQIYQIVHKCHGKNPEFFINIWDKLLQHPQLAIIERLIHTLSQSENGTLLLADEAAMNELIDLFNASPNYALSDALITEKINDLGILTEICLRLHALSAFSSHLLEPIIFEQTHEIILELLKIYQAKIYKAHQESTKIMHDLDKLLIHNQDILAKISQLKGMSSSYMQDLQNIVVYSLTKSAEEEQAHVTKRKSFSHKVLKILHLKPPNAKPKTAILETIIKASEQGEDDKTAVNRLSSRWSTSMGRSSLFPPQAPSSDELLNQHSSNSV